MAKDVGATVKKIVADHLGVDVSNCVAFLSSLEASYITGETIHVNGGMYMSWQNSLIIY